MNVMQPSSPTGVGTQQQAAVSNTGATPMKNNLATKPALVNTIQFADLLATATELGAQAGQGKDTQIKFMLKSIEAGYHSAVDLQSNKHGNGVDDAMKLAEAYFKGQTGSNVFDHKAGNQRKLASTVRTSIKLGMWPKGGSGEPIATVNSLMTERQTLKKNPANHKRMDDAVNTLMRFARAQLKLDTLIPRDQLGDFCMKPEGEPATVSDILASTEKKLTKLIDGVGGLQHAGKHVISARDNLRSEISAIARQAKV